MNLAQWDETDTKLVKLAMHGIRLKSYSTISSISYSTILVIITQHNHKNIIEHDMYLWIILKQ